MKMKKLTKLMSFSLAMLLTFSLGVTNVSAAPAAAASTVEVTDGEGQTGGTSENAGGTGSGDTGEGEQTPTVDQETGLIYGKIKGTLTLNEGAAGVKVDSKYSVYKVLSAVEDKGQNVYGYTLTKDFENSGVSVEEIEAATPGLDTHEIDSSTVDAIAVELENYIKTENEKNPDTIVPEATFESGVQQDLSIGYYLILETTTTEGMKEIKPMLVSIPETTDDGKYKYEVEVTLKDQPITTTKTIEESKQKQQDSIAQQVGKEFTFKIVQDVPKYDDTYKDVVFKVHDTMSKGLNFGEVVSVQTETGNQSTSLDPNEYGFTKNSGDTPGTTELEFDFSRNKEQDNKNYYNNVKDADRVIITYTAKLNKDASFTGNKNEVYPEFGNDPEQTTTGEKDITANYAGMLELVKQDAEENVNGKKDKLEGAEFTVYEADGKTEAKLVTYTVDGNGQITEIVNDSLSATAITDKDGVAKFYGLGDGTYYIKETKGPNGYIRLKDPIKLTVTVDLPDKIETGNEPAIFTYKVTTEDGEVWDGVVSSSSEDETVTITVDNTAGFTLPTTGGMGTYLFTIGGALLIIVAVVLLVASRKKKH